MLQLNSKVGYIKIMILRKLSEKEIALQLNNNVGYIKLMIHRPFREKEKEIYLEIIFFIRMSFQNFSSAKMSLNIRPESTVGTMCRL